MCPTEIIAFSDAAKNFEALGATVIGASTDTAETHLAWIRTPRKRGGLGKLNIPLVADVTKVVSAQYGVLNPSNGVAFRGLFLIDPAGILQQVTMNNLSVGRDVKETLRLLQAFQYVASHDGEVCPAGWTPGAATMLASPEGSSAYFESQAEGEEEADIMPSIPAIRSAAELESALAKGKVVLDWYAPWCAKCHKLAPFVEELAAKHPDIAFFKLDTDALPELAKQYGAASLPTFTFHKEGRPAHEPIVGYKKSALEAALEALQ